MFSCYYDIFYHNILSEKRYCMTNLDYGAIGNSKSAALISKTGTIEWCCLPDFTSPSLFAKILDRQKGGEFSIYTEKPYTIRQNYIDKTNILVTHFTGEGARFDIIDFMPRYKTDTHQYHCPPDIIRYIKVHEGEPEVTVIFDPKPGYAQYPCKIVVEDDFIKSESSKGKYESFYLYTDLDKEAVVKGSPITLKGDCFFLLTYNQKLLEFTAERVFLEYERTKLYWLNWSDQTRTFAKYNKEILRSALVLKLLSYQKTGAMLAAITTSLPESIGSERNWDYRFCWMRDASMTISTLTNLGHYNVAKRFLDFIINIIHYKDEKIQIMYGIRGEKVLLETELPWLDGYENSKPVRVGNAAHIQKQNDIYGILIDVIHEYFRVYSNTLDNSEELWTIIRSLIRTVKKYWRKSDMGIWEFRTKKQHFTFSKVLCWVAFDRASKIATILGKKKLAAEWSALGDEIKENILEHGWKPELQAFTQSYESNSMDAANLLMAHYGFLDANNPKYVMTVKKTRDELCQNGLMFRYKNKDDFGEPESSFTVCTFWLIKSLYLIGEKKEAQELFDRVLTHANHLGLFSEDISFKTQRLLGNFPQAYSHLALIDTAITLSQRKVDEEDQLLNRLHATAETAKV
jgi:alpha,alpha-trehalase